MPWGNTAFHFYSPERDGVPPFSKGGLGWILAGHNFIPKSCFPHLLQNLLQIAVPSSEEYLLRLSPRKQIKPGLTGFNPNPRVKVQVRQYLLEFDLEVIGLSFVHGNNKGYIDLQIAAAT